MSTRQQGVVLLRHMIPCAACKDAAAHAYYEVDVIIACWYLLFLCREGELQSAAFGANEASCHLNELRAQVDQLAAATRTAEETAAAATGA
jgi:hypothetical protein